MSFIALFAKNHIGALLIGIGLIFLSGLANIALIWLVGRGLDGPDGPVVHDLFLALTFLLAATFALGVAAQRVLDGIGHNFIYQHFGQF